LIQTGVRATDIIF